MVNQSYVGSITNPIVEARADLLMSQQALARKLGLSKQYMNRAENGTYSALSPALLKWVANAMGWTTQSTAKRYAQFQEAKRKQTVENINPHKLMGGTTFANWRAGYWPSTIAFANDFCVHPDLIQKYEAGVQKSMPKMLREVLTANDLLDPEWNDNYM